MNKEQARELAHTLLCIFSKEHLEENLAKPFIIDICANNILKAVKSSNIPNGTREVLKKLIFSNIKKDKGNPYEYYIYYGVYRIVFRGEADSSLVEMNDYFLSKIEEIAGALIDD